MGEEVVSGTIAIPDGMFELELAGRMILFHKVSEGQTTALQRYLIRLRDELNTADRQRQYEIYQLIHKAPLDIIETRFTNTADRDWVEQQLMMDLLDINQLMRVFANGAPIEDPAPADDADPAPKRKRAAKKVANASRARR